MSSQIIIPPDFSESLKTQSTDALVTFRGNIFQLLTLFTDECMIEILELTPQTPDTFQLLIEKIDMELQNRKM